MYYDITYIHANLPDTVEACTIPDTDNYGYIIVINAKLSVNAKRRAIKHELEHIKKDDCYNDTEIAETLELENKVQ